MEIINKRRSVREFDVTLEVKEEDLLLILRAGMQAPSARNQRPWKFIVIRNLEILERLKTISKGSRAIENSRLVVALMMQPNEKLIVPDFKLEDMAACIQNMMLESQSLGIGSCWIGIAPLSERMDTAKEILQVENDVFALLAIGYPKDKSVFKFIDRFEEDKIQYLD